jgi:hypothetical protein
MACAQTRSTYETISRMTADLLPLKDALTSTEPLKESYTWDELRSLVTVSQNRVIQAFRKDLFALEGRLNREQAKRMPADRRPIGGVSFMSPVLEYQLTWVLAGKDLSEENVRPLAEAVVAMVESGVRLQGTSTGLEESGEFRNAARKAWDALAALGVGSADVEIVSKGLFEGAKKKTLPPVVITYK